MKYIVKKNGLVCELFTTKLNSKSEKLAYILKLRLAGFFVYYGQNLEKRNEQFSV
jgi:hypothetical protein